MHDEPIHAELREDDNQPATKGDVRKSQEELAAMMANSLKNIAAKDDLKALDQRMVTFDGRMNRLEESMTTKDQLATVMNLVQSIDQQLKEWRGIPAKVERLHKAVFPHR